MQRKKHVCNRCPLSPHSDICFDSGDTCINLVTQSQYMNTKWNLAVERFSYDSRNLGDAIKNNPLWIATGSAVPIKEDKPHMDCKIGTQHSDNTAVCGARTMDVVQKIICKKKLTVF